MDSTVLHLHQPAWQELLWLVLLAPVLWWLGRGSWEDAKLRLRREAGLALACGAALAGAADLRASALLRRVAFIGDDLARICDCLAATRDGDWDSWNYMLSVMPSALLAPLADHLGVLGALSWGALASGAGVGVSIYVWGRAVHGPLAGVAAVGVASAMVPLIVLVRTLTFYPITAACFTACLAGGAVCMRWRTVPGLVVGASGIVLALCADLRGLIFALPVVGLVLLAAILPPSRKLSHAVGRLGLVIGVLAGGYGLGSFAYPPATRTLEVQLAGAMRMASQRFEGAQAAAPITTGYVWGRSPVQEIPATLLTMAAQTAAVPDTSQNRKNQKGLNQIILPWLPPVAAGLVLAVVGLVRRPLSLIALLATLTPGLALVRSSIRTDYHLRYLIAAAPGFAVVAGVGFAVLVLGPRLRARPPWLPAPLPLPLGGAVALALLCAWTVWLPPGHAQLGTGVDPGAVGRAVARLPDFEGLEAPEARIELEAMMIESGVLLRGVKDGRSCVRTLARDAAPGPPLLATRPFLGTVRAD